MLCDTVLSLKAMRIPPGVQVEVLVIDNDPDGGARTAAAELEPICRDVFAVRYVHETRTGLSHARNRGIEESRGEVIGFLDDDVFVHEQWLTSMLQCFEEHPADCVGGRTVVYWEGEPDPVLKACEEQIMALDQGEDSFEVCGQRLPGGGNAAYRRTVFERGLRFSTNLGRVGKVMLSGEDTELFLRLRRGGGRIWYCGAAAVRHRTQGERLSCSYVVKQKYWFGVSRAVIDRQVQGVGHQMCRACARLVKLVCVAVPQFILARLLSDRPAEFLARCAAAKQIGYLRATIRPLADVATPPALTSHPPAVVPTRV
jgi:glycosyltransferase involved in cell wall biosynthesis